MARQSDSAKEPLSSRLSAAFLKPPAAGQGGPGTGTRYNGGLPETVSELEEAVARADDKERLVGLLAAPIAAALGLIITGTLINNDPKALLASGAINKLHVNPTLYLELGAVALALSLVMMAMAYFRKRVYLGIAMALYGLSIFNLHFWGFGIPFILAGAWFLVRAYRFQQKLKEANTSSTATFESKRYTPPNRRKAS
ncbi:MAG TPA: hypothetical protein VHU85_04375 [Acidimicrobiales bacterium]|jgi:uncharacterized membrane protein|nr:hypothetical protein [Acidimicrobiales bacterium]